jgi:hypothetical protein
LISDWVVIGYLKGDSGCVLTDGADHDDPVCDDLVDLLHERLLHKTRRHSNCPYERSKKETHQVEVIGTSDGEVDDVHLGCDGVVERVEEPGCVRHLCHGWKGRVIGQW